eukprot:TRINITY_DN80064_c0_g1_i1.p1 TRINITY_DN80064_c0_g1~~TRINITY_DN80064_c0_g1_i1.p1  ORF type:complete len:140 (-),score=21.02 TRINITY_DN80064_c0_g1_i1:104-523(-)
MDDILALVIRIDVATEDCIKILSRKPTTCANSHRMLAQVVGFRERILIQSSVATSILITRARISSITVSRSNSTTTHCFSSSSSTSFCLISFNDFPASLTSPFKLDVEFSNRRTEPIRSSILSTSFPLDTCWALAVAAP